MIVAAALFLMIEPTTVRAQSEQDRKDCFSVGTNNYDNPSFYDAGLAACDKFVKSGRYRGTDLHPYVKQRADWLRRKGELAAALRDFAWAIELNPNDVENYDFRGDVYVERGEYDRAIEDYNTSIRINPRYPPAYYSRGLAYQKAGRLDDAIASFRQAARLSLPDSTNPNTIRLYEWGINQAKEKLKELGR